VISYDIAVVGGGASGLAAAVMARRLGKRAVLLERGARVGKKLLVTGNGRCNLTNTTAAPADYFGGFR
jgi:predicted flavoprotein YhiN